MSQCNRCRREFGPDDERVRGQHTPAEWCLPCADAAGLTGNRPIENADPMEHWLSKRQIAREFPDFAAAMRALQVKAASNARRDVSLRIVGSE